MTRNECIQKIEEIFGLEEAFIAIKKLNTKQEMERENSALSVKLVGWYNLVKEYVAKNPNDSEVVEQFNSLSKIINIANQIDDYIRYDR